MKSLDAGKLQIFKNFCEHRVYRFGCRAQLFDNGVKASWGEQHTHYHDGYEYERGAWCSVEKVQDSEYQDALNHAILQYPHPKWGYLSKLLAAVEKSASDVFLFSYEESTERCSMVLFARDLFGAEGCFMIEESHWDTM